MELELLGLFSLVLPLLFDRLPEVTGPIPDEDGVNVLVVIGNDACKLIWLAVFEPVEQLASLSLFDRL